MTQRSGNDVYGKAKSVLALALQTWESLQTLKASREGKGESVEEAEGDKSMEIDLRVSPQWQDERGLWIGAVSGH